MIAAEQTEPGVSPGERWGPQALHEMREARRKLQVAAAERRHDWILSNRYFYDRLKRILQFIVEPGKRVLDVRCETGYLMASLNPSRGVGVEISDAMVACASRQYPELQFVRSDPEDLELGEKFDYIVFNHIFDTVDILRAFEQIRRHCTENTRLIVINYNYLWQPILEWASNLGFRSRFVEPNWVSENDIRGFLRLAGFRPVRKHRLLLFPKWIPLLSGFLNDFLARLPGLQRLCLMHVMVARPIPQPIHENDVSVSVIIPCRNEVGNVQLAVERIPSMGKHTEIIFCDDKSTDGTADEVRRMQMMYPDKDIRLLEGPGICKAENVWTGFHAAHGDALMILDADLTVMPEELPMFLRALVHSHGEFVNGSRLVYPMQQNAMKFANTVGNKCFSLLFSFLLDQRIKDTLCGTKVLWRKDWLRLERLLGRWGIKDHWGNYELLFGASKLHLEIAEVPVHYQERIHGVTKMTRVFSNGLRMLGICWRAWYCLGG
jgi:SAM-dependent methyltransferase